MPDDLADVIDTLRARRAEHAASIDLLDKAIENLTMLVNPQVPLTAATTEVTTALTLKWATTKSVRSLVLDLLDEVGRTWTTDEIIEEYERRGQPLSVQDPRNAMFSALSRLSKAGEIIRVGHGRYIGKKYAASVPDLTIPAGERGEEADLASVRALARSESAEEAPKDE